MERDERDRADALDRHWDALLRGETTAATADLDADLATLVARLHAAGSAIPTLFPDPDQAWRELRQISTPATVSGATGRQRLWPGRTRMAMSLQISSRGGRKPLRRGVGAAGSSPSWRQPPCCCSPWQPGSRRSGSARPRRRMRGGGCRRWCAPSRPPPAVSSTRRWSRRASRPRSCPTGRRKPSTTGSPSLPPPACPT